MSVTMLGNDVARAMEEELIKEREELEKKGVIPSLHIIRTGAGAADLSYERGARKKMEKIGIKCETTAFPEDVKEEEFMQVFREINESPKVSGILLLRPLPSTLREEPLRELFNPHKDVDGMSPINVAKLFSGDKTGFVPCTAQAVMEMLNYYKIEPAGKKAVVIGRSMTVGKPLSLLLLERNATVTTCHTKTKGLAKLCREADILVTAAGQPRLLTKDMVKEGAVVADVGVNTDERGKLCGDADFEDLKAVVSYISPVPKGVGSVTSSVLAKHILKGAKRLCR